MGDPSLLITQCLQNDFVQPVAPWDPIPNALHVGHHEARRLMGDDPAEGPVARTMQWAHRQPDARLRVIHIRDWHDAADPAQMDHLARFGRHCLADTAGAAFAFGPGDAGKEIAIVDSRHLNDFVETNLEEVLRPWRGAPRRVGLVGVWTEAKISFLAYELLTRFPCFQLAVCSALTASSSRQHHFTALDRLERILGVRVIDSVGEFLDHLVPGEGARGDDPPALAPTTHPKVSADFSLDEVDHTVVRYLYRDCRRVELKGLGGGYSGNVVAATRSEDAHGHEQVPHVVKIGEAAAIGRERTRFERIQEVLGNNAPQISDFVDYQGRGALKYRYASMGGDGSTTFQRRYAEGASEAEIARVLDTVFGEQLMRLYRAATLESCDLLAHYYFSSERAPAVRAAVARISGRDPTGERLHVAEGLTTFNPCTFYEHTLANLPRRANDQCYFGFVHGDLNGANIILDGRDNVWLIDFFHTQRAHVLMDLVKLENDLLYIFTPIENEDDLREACEMTDVLMEVEDLAAELPGPPLPQPALRRAWSTITKLRSFYPALVHTDRDPFQLLVAQLRYAAHTLSFDEPTPLQHRWALYATGQLTREIGDRLARSSKLRLDWLDPALTAPGRIALTLLPGRRDFGRKLQADLEVLAAEKIDRVLCLVPDDELEQYGVPELLDALRAAGIEVYRLSIPDQRTASDAEMDTALRWLHDSVRLGGRTVVHCVGGLGRSGMAAACYLRARGLEAEPAISEVRRARSPRAIETRAQEDFVRMYDAPTL